MKEADWLRSEWPEEVLNSAWRKVSARKLRLLACACCRTFWPILADAGSRRVVEASEQFADGAISLAALRRARAAAPGRGASRSTDRAAAAAVHVAGNVAFHAAELALRSALRLAGEARPASAAQDDYRHCPRLADLVRHILGKPYQRLSTPESWPASVVQLAEALYRGEDCSFALHDALLEAGHTELAAHFQEKDHPKGCWALDLILAKR
jgi:hypothetical protein